FPKYLLLSLVISEIEYGRGASRKVYYNLPQRRTDGVAFSEPLNDFLAMGLTTEDVRRYTRLGAPFDKYPDPKDIVDLDAKGIRVVDLGNSRYQMEKVGPVSRFCFDPALADATVPVRVGMPIAKTGEILTADLLCGADREPA